VPYVDCQLDLAFEVPRSAHIDAISASEAIMAITKNHVMTVIQITPAVPPLKSPK
jgi:hypothetical protein